MKHFFNALAIMLTGVLIITAGTLILAGGMTLVFLGIDWWMRFCAQHQVHPPIMLGCLIGGMTGAVLGSILCLAAWSAKR